MRFCIHKLGLNIIGEINAPGYLEGGDFFPAGPDLCLLGIGLRSNFDAAQQLMDEDLLGTNRLAIVEDRFEKDQDRMHLDCVFSILGEDVCLMYEDMIGKASPKKRLVQEWVRGINGKYQKMREEVEFAEYMEQEGYKIIPISEKEQLAYGCNVLNLG